MSKKHFEALAQSLANYRPIPWLQSGLAAYNTWLACCRVIGEVCKQFSPKFNSERFLEACRTYKPIEVKPR